MKVSPSLDEVRKIAATGAYKVLPVSCEILSDICTPIEALKKLKNVSTHCYMLESAQQNEKWGRYTFLGFDPKLEITALTTDGEVMAVQHREYPIYGVQFHPESIMTPDGKRMLENFIKLN